LVALPMTTFEGVTKQKNHRSDIDHVGELRWSLVENKKSRKIQRRGASSYTLDSHTKSSNTGKFVKDISIQTIRPI
jgi:hypothetical protein